MEAVLFMDSLAIALTPRRRAAIIAGG